MNEIDVIKFESEIKKEQEAPQIVEPIVDSKVIENIEQNLSTEESINPIFTTFDKALKIAKEENKIVLLTVVANNCKFCKKMEDEVLSIDGVQEAIKKDLYWLLLMRIKSLFLWGLVHR
jgi:thioredoxin-related protein